MKPSQNAKPQSLPFSMDMRIDEICQRFEEEWQSGGRPLIGDYLPDWPESERNALRGELQKLESVYLNRGEAVESTIANEAPTTASDNAALATLPKINGYEILEKIGQGGMGVVYKARHLKLNRLVALKMILAGVHASDIETQRFLAEAEAVAAFQHPNVVQVYEVGQHQNVPYMALELVSGGSLADRLKNGPLAPKEAVQLLEKLAHGMNAAHQAGIVHRDLKPANILLSDSGAESIPKVTDFGLAKKVEGSGAITQTGAIVGTPSYMAPEQAKGQSKRVGPAADVYALGAMLYECLTGEPPFKSDNPMETLMQVVNDEPMPLSQLQGRLSKDLQTICLKCLQKEPQKRYASAAELAADLRRFQEGEPIAARPVSSAERTIKWIRRKPAATALIAVSGFAFAAIVIINVIYNARLQDLIGDAQLKQANLTKKTQETNRLKADLTKKTAETEELKTGAAAFNRLASERLGFANLAAGSRHLEQGNTADALLFFSEAAKIDRSDPERLQEHSARVLAFSRPLPRLANIIEHKSGGILGGFYRFSPDGKFLATAGRDEVRLWDLRRGTSVLLPGKERRRFAFAPSGRYLLRWQWEVKDDKPEKSHIEIWETTSGKNLTPNPGFWVPSRRILGLSFPKSNRLAVVRWRRPLPKKRAVFRCSVFTLPSGQAVPFPAAAAPEYANEILSPDGKRIVRFFNNTVIVWEISTPMTTPFAIKPPERMRYCYFDPTSRYLLISVENKRSKARSFRIWDVKAGRFLTRVPQPIALTRFDFSSDGRYFRIYTKNQVRVWRLPSGESASPVIQTTAPMRSAQFSHNGLFLVTQTEEQTQLWNVAGGTPMGKPILHDTTSFHRNVGFGPNSRHVLYWDARRIELRDVMGRLLWSYKVAGGNLRSLSGAGIGPNGKYLVARENTPRDQFQPNAEERSTIHVWRLSPPGVEPKLVLQRPTTGYGDWAFLNDGRLLRISDRRTMELWELSSERKIELPLSDLSRVEIGRSIENDRLLLLHDRNKDRIQLWNPFPSAPKVHFSFPGKVLHSVHTASKTLLALSDDDSVYLWNVRTGKRLTHEFPKALRAQFSPEGRYSLLTCHDGWVRVFEVDSGKQKAAAKLLEGPPIAFRFSNHDRFFIAFPQVVPRMLFTPPPAFPFRVWNLATGKLLIQSPVDSGEGAAYKIRASRDGSVFALLNNKFGTIEFAFFDGKSGKRLDGERLQRPNINSLHFSPKGERAILLGQNGKLYIWDRRNSNQLSPPIGGFDTTAGMASGDGRFLALQQKDKAQLTVWNLETGEPLPKSIPLFTKTQRTPQAILDRFAIIRFSPDGERVLIQEPATIRNESGMFSSPGSDWSQYAARMWDLKTGRLLFPAVRCQNVPAQFSADGRYFYMLTAHSHGSIRSSQTGFPVVIETNIIEPFTQIGKAKSISPLPTFLSPDGRKLWRIQGNIVQEFDYSPQPSSHADSHLKAEWFAGKRIGKLGQLTPIWEHDREKIWQQLKRKFPAEFGMPDRENMNHWRRHLLTDPHLETSWFSQHWHLSRLIESAGGTPELYRERFLADLALGRWHSALEDGRRANLKSPFELFAFGLMQVEARDLAGYRENCQKASKWLEKDEVWNEPQFVILVRLFLLGDHPRQTFNSLIRRVEARKTLSLKLRTFAPYPISNAYSRHFELLGRLHYRAGQFNKARMYFEAATCSPEGTSGFLGFIAPPTVTPASLAVNFDQIHRKLWRLGKGRCPVNHLYMAMTSKKSGDDQLAKKWLQEFYARESPPPTILGRWDNKTDHLRVPLHFLEERVLVQETEQVLSGKK